MKLPELPQPDTHCFDTDTDKDVWSYSKEQVLALREATVEACAKMCDETAVTHEQGDDAATGSYKCADAIRELLR